MDYSYTCSTQILSRQIKSSKNQVTILCFLALLISLKKLKNKGDINEIYSFFPIDNPLS